MLEQILRVPHMPPDVRIVEVLAVHNEDELQANEDEGKNTQERCASTKPSAETSAETEGDIWSFQRRWRVFHYHSAGSSWLEPLIRARSSPTRVLQFGFHPTIRKATCGC